MRTEENRQKLAPALLHNGSAARPPEAWCVCVCVFQVSTVQNGTINPSGLLHNTDTEHIN